MDIYLKHAILHIIDRQTGYPVFSQKELDLTKEYTRDYFTKENTENCYTANQNRPFTQESQSIAQRLKSEEDFVAASEAIVQRWFEVYKESEDAPSADAFVVLYELDTGMQLAF